MTHRPFVSEYGAATIAAQQKLSQQYGIPTFDISGNVSTVPTTQLSPLALTVGTGRYSNTPQSFVNILSNAINQVKSTGGQIANTIFNAPTSTSPQNNTPSGGQQGAANPSNTQPPSGSSSIGVDLAKGFDSIKNYIGPTGLLVGIGFIAFLALRGRNGG